MTTLPEGVLETLVEELHANTSSTHVRQACVQGLRRAVAPREELDDAILVQLLEERCKWPTITEKSWKDTAGAVHSTSDTERP